MKEKTPSHPIGDHAVEVEDHQEAAEGMEEEEAIPQEAHPMKETQSPQGPIFPQTYDQSLVHTMLNQWESSLTSLTGIGPRPKHSLIS